MRARKSDGRPVSLVGTSIPPLEATEKVTGRAQYVTDIELPNMAHAKVLRSPLPHARIVSIDASAARELSGVVCVVTRDELRADPDIDPIYGFVYRDAPIIGLEKVRHQGDIVAVVVAEDIATAEEALQLIDVEYDELPVVMDAAAAMAEGAPLVHDKFSPIAPELVPIEGTNVCHHTALERGDVEEGFRQADFVYEDSYSAPPVQHCALEPHACIAQVDEDGVTVWTNCQSPFPLKRELERMFKLPARVIVPFVGGGFGSKSRDRMEAMTTAAAKLAKRPVRLAFTQEETFQNFIRPAYTCTIKTGVTRDGIIVAREMRYIQEAGAYAISGARSANNTLKVATGPYRIPNALVDCQAVYTNKPPSAPYRGLSSTQHTMAYETQLDRIARDLSIDPLEIRRRNIVADDGDIHITGDYLRSTHARQCLDQVAASLDWGKQPSPSEDTKLRGKGIGCTIKYTLTPPHRMSENEAEVALLDDGVFEVRFGTVNIGQGSDTTMAQIAADALGIGLDSIRIVHSDTGRVPVDSSTTASRSTFHTGNAILDAVANLKTELVEAAAGLLEQPVEALSLTPEGIAENGQVTLTFADLVQQAGGPLSAIGDCEVGGTFTGPDGSEYPITSTFWTFAAAGAEVEVDTETGQIRILRMGAAANAGTVINPRSVLTQLEGGLGMELGPILFERMTWDEGGQLLNAALMDYPLPTMETMPEYHPSTVEFPFPGGPFGAKGMGEIASVVAPAAVINAVYDAIGVQIHEVPLLPHIVLAALDSVAAAKGAKSGPGGS